MALHRFTFRAMAAANEVQIHSASPEWAEAAAERAIAEVARIEEKYSRAREASLVSRINRQSGGAPVAIDAETRSLLGYAETCFRQSGGLFDPTSGVLRRAWRFDAAKVPSDEEIAPLLSLIGWERVELTQESVRLPLPGMELDFGGFGKEHGVDRAAAAVREAGAQSALVNLAGDLAVLGSQPDGSA